MVACGDSSNSVSTTTSVVPSSPATPTGSSPGSTAEQSPASGTPALLIEKDLPTQTATAYALDWSADGQALAVASGVELTFLNSDLSETIAVVKPASGAVAAWNPERNAIATVGGLRNSKISIWDWDSASGALTSQRELSAGSDQFAVSWSPDGSRLATLANDRKSNIQIWDTSSWTMVGHFDLPFTNPRRALTWSADGREIYDGGEAGGQFVYFSVDVDDGSVRELGRLPTESASVFAIATDADKFAIADEHGDVQIRELASGNLLSEFQAVDAPADIAWNPKGPTLAILGGATTLQLWSL
jgi:WD40 repeat protein